MKLTDLDPRWLLIDGARIGFVFRSPKDPKYWQTCFQSPTPTRKQQRLLYEAMFGDDDFLVQGSNPDGNWTIHGGIANASFETMTVTPSLDGSPGGLWHGFITNGEIA